MSQSTVTLPPTTPHPAQAKWRRHLLATILPRYQFRLLPGASVAPEPLITLRPGGSLLMTITRKGEQR